MDIKGKRILFLSATLFGYQNEIKEQIKRLGACVDYFDERPTNTFFVKAMIRINRNFIAGYIDSYHQRIIEQTKGNNYDIIFITKGESISASTLKELKQIHPQAQFIIYHWDSIANNKNALTTLDVFDKVFSFDRPDCDKLGLNFLPLFFIEQYKEVGSSNQVQDIDMLFVGTAHSDRYKLIKSIVNGYKSFLYIYFPSPILYYKMKLSDAALKETKRTDFHFTSIPQSEIIELYKRTKTVIDIQHPKQTGLTMRSIEVLGAKRKLITTNQHIKEYDFYHKDNILVVDRINPVVEQSFLDTPYREISMEIYEKYTLRNWVKTILG